MEFAAKTDKVSTDSFFRTVSRYYQPVIEKPDSVKSSVATDGHFAPNFNLLHELSCKWCDSLN